jgi:hypothetical protein
LPHPGATTVPAATARTINQHLLMLDRSFSFSSSSQRLLRLMAAQFLEPAPATTTS